MHTNNSNTTNNDPVIPRSLDSSELVKLKTIQEEFPRVEQLELDYHMRRALMFRQMWQFVASVGQLALEHHVETVLAFDVKKFRKAGFNVCSLAVTGINVFGETDSDKRKLLHNRVQPVTLALDALDHLRSQHEHLNDDDFVAWWNENGRLSGLHAKLRADRKPLKPQPAGRSADEVIADLLANASAFELSGVPGLSTGTVSVFVAQGEGSKARMVRLDTTPEFVASLASHAPDPMNSAPANLLLYRQLLTVGEAIIPDRLSSIPKRPLQPGEKVSLSTEMLASNTILLWTGNCWSIASSRQHDTMVLEVEPLPGIETFMPSRLVFIDTKTRHTMLDRLSNSSTVAGYIKEGVGMEEQNGRRAVKFTHTDRKLNGQLIAKSLDDLGTVDTRRVLSFNPSASAALAPNVVKAFDKEFLVKLIKKKDGKPVEVAITSGQVSFKHGAAEAKTYTTAEVTGEADVRVLQDDLKRALTGLIGLAGQAPDLAVAIDKRGLLRITAKSDQATFHVYIQTLRAGQNEDGRALERALLQVVARPEVEQQLAA